MVGKAGLEDSVDVFVLFTEVRWLWDIWGEKVPGEAGATTVALREERSKKQVEPFTKWMLEKDFF